MERVRRSFNVNIVGLVLVVVMRFIDIIKRVGVERIDIDGEGFLYRIEFFWLSII